MPPLSCPGFGPLARVTQCLTDEKTSGNVHRAAKLTIPLRVDIAISKHELFQTAKK